MLFKHSNLVLNCFRKALLKHTTYVNQKILG